MANLPRKAAKQVKFKGNSLRDLRGLPATVRREAGYQLDRVQNGLEPEDFKAMPTVGVGAQEIRLKDDSGIFRVLYVTKFEEVLYVLHCFRKKTQKTSKSDIDLARKRYAEIIQERQL